MEFDGPFDPDDVSAAYQTNDLTHIAAEVYLEIAADMESMLYHICEMQRDRVPDPFSDDQLTSARGERLLEDIYELMEALELMEDIEETGSVPFSHRLLADLYPEALFRAMINELEETGSRVNYGEAAQILKEYREMSEN